jgi:hypothetical protein
MLFEKVIRTPCGTLKSAAHTLKAKSQKPKAKNQKPKAKSFTQNLKQRLSLAMFILPTLALHPSIC